MKSAENENSASEKPVIHNRGRGPEIEGTRITVYDVLDYMLAGWHCERIAFLFKLHPEEIQVAMDYIRDHSLEVLREYVKILERCERGNPPELQAKLDARHEQFQELLRKVREAKARGENNVRELIEEYRASGGKEALHAGNHGGS